MMHFLFCAVALVAFALIVAAGIGGHRTAMRQRLRLLDEASGLVDDPAFGLSPDQFPIVTGRIADGRKVKIELIADTMVTRRLPQLWLSVTVLEAGVRDIPALGALARPTGSEYYSLVPGLPEWMAPPEIGVPLLMRGSADVTSAQALAAGKHFRALFADLSVKEAVITPRAARVIYQASQGGRAAHMLLRQAQFPLETVPAAIIMHTIALAVELRPAMTPDAEPSRACAAA